MSATSHEDEPIVPTATGTGPGERTLTDQGRERRQQLLDTAGVLFAERGYANTRVIDICDAAGVAKGLFYWYFENKEALFADLVRTMRLRLRRAQAEHVDPGSDPLTRLRRGAEASVRFMAEHMAYFALLELESRDRVVSALLREGNEVHMADTALLVKEAQAAGQIPRHLDPDLLAVGVNATVAHFSHYHRVGKVTTTVEELAAFAGGWVVRAVGGR
jgi:AcrR family transcriptional regulator